MLGVQRTSISMYASELQTEGVITYRHGTLRIVDWKGLEAAACSCHAYTARQRGDLAFEPIRVAS
jgi:hypothetical protein